MPPVASLSVFINCASVYHRRKRKELKREKKRKKNEKKREKRERLEEKDSNSPRDGTNKRQKIDSDDAGAQVTCAEERALPSSNTANLANNRSMKTRDGEVMSDADGSPQQDMQMALQTRLLKAHSEVLNE
jgi:hypothetical protein